MFLGSDDVDMHQDGDAVRKSCFPRVFAVEKTG
jgi:hypothetical protein